MFDFSIGELMVVMVVALVVIGPERLPKVARTMGHLYGRAQRYVNGVKSDIARDMAIEEYRQLQQKIQAEASSLQESVQQTAHTVSEQMQQINRAIIEQVQQPAEPAARTPGLDDEHTLESVEKQVAEQLSQPQQSVQADLFTAHGADRAVAAVSHPDEVGSRSESVVRS